MDRSHRLVVNRMSGFTIVELVIIIVIMGILAAMAAPRFFDRNVFDSRGFYDQVITTLRYAQKAAIAQHRFVCVAFTANSVTLTTGVTAACDTNLIGPVGSVSPPPCAQDTYSVCNSNASFTATPAPFNFDALGSPTPAPPPFTVSGYPVSITVEAETGYVH